MAWTLHLTAACTLGLVLALPLFASHVVPDDKDTASEPGIIDRSASSEQILLLDVIVNGYAIGRIGQFTLRHGTLYAHPRELHDLGFLVPTSLGLRDDQIALNDLPGFEWTLDMQKQELHITAVDAILIPTVLQPTLVEGRERNRTIESGTGLTLNYDTTGSFASGQNGGSGSFDLRAFSPRGIANSDWLTYAGSMLTASSAHSVVRLDSAYTFADVRTLRRYSLGDYINGGLSWERPVHMEGVQIRSDFSMRPDLITFPLPSMSGSAAVPSTVDVLVNGNVVSSTQVDPGPFRIQQLPVISGAGTITMTVTNTQGQQVTVTQPFYGGSTLLAQGLQTFAVQTGLIRRNWGTTSNDYGKMAATAFFRRGLTQSFTVEATGQATPGAEFGGVGTAALLGAFAVANLDLAAGTGSGRFGRLASAGVQHIGRVFSIGGSATLASRGFRDVAAVNGSGILRKQISMFTGLSVRRFGSVGMAYAELNQDPAPEPQSATSDAQSSHVVTANYAIQLGHLSFYATEFRNLDSSGSSGLQAGVTMSLGRRRSATISGSSSGSTQFQTQQSPTRIGEWGYLAYASAGGDEHEFAEAQYKSPVGLLTAGADRISGKATYRVETQGAISLVDRGLFPSNTVYDSFAIVDTAPLGHVHVYQENRDVGVTGSSGRLLVPDMRAFDVNHISIEPKDIPADASLSLDTRIVRPQDRSGVVVRFPTHFSHSALLKVVDASGAPIPLGSTATLRSSGVIAPVGYDGEVYFEDLGPHNLVSVERLGHRSCTVAFDYVSIPGDIPTIGPVRCLESQP